MRYREKAGLGSPAVIDDVDQPRDLAALVVPLSGRLEATSDPWLPFRLADSVGEILSSPGGTVLAERETLTRTWELSLDLLTARGHSYARPLLRLLSFLAAGPLPSALLDVFILSDSHLFKNLSPAGLRATVIGLIGVGLVDHHANDSGSSMVDAIVLHPVVRDSCQSQPDAAADAENYRAGCLALLVRDAVDSDPNDPTLWPKWRMLLPHCQHIIDELAATTGADDQRDFLTAFLASQAASYSAQAVHVPTLSVSVARLWQSKFQRWAPTIHTL